MPCLVTVLWNKMNELFHNLNGVQGSYLQTMIINCCARKWTASSTRKHFFPIENSLPIQQQ